MNILSIFRFIVALTLQAASPGAEAAGDWPQWQGPDRDGIAHTSGLLQEWPEGGPPLAWKVDGLGGGDSAPAVVDGRLFGMSSRDGKEIVWARSAADGKELWATPLGDAVEQRTRQSREGPACTPCIDGDHLYVIGMGGAVACLKARDGEIVWRRSMTEDFGGVPPMWSYRESPLVDGGKVICTPGSAEAMMVALDKATGVTIWKSPMPASPEPSADEGARRETTERVQQRPDGRQRGERPGRGEMASRSDRGNASATRDAAPQVTGTEDPALFLSEHWGMSAFSQEVPDGKYLAKLYFAETFSGVTGPGGRVFSFDVEGKEFKDFDIWEKAGGPRKAYIESVPVEVTDGRLDIAFTRQVESPAIKAIEIVPQDDDADEAETVRIKAGQDTPFKDSSGNVWLADRGFTGGQTSPGFFGVGGGDGGRPGGSGGRGGAGRSGAAYSSAIAIDFEGVRQYVQLTANALVGVAASDGKVLWSYDAPANRMGINCSTPIHRDGLVFASSAYGNGGGAAKLSKGADGRIEAKEVYFTNRMQNHHGGMIVIDGALYGAHGGNEGGFLACIDFATGDILWRDRDAPKGALLLADGRLYLRAEDGEVLLIEPSPADLVVHGRFRQPGRSDSPAWAHPVIAGGKLYIRDQGLLLAYDVAERDD